MKRVAVMACVAVLAGVSAASASRSAAHPSLLGLSFAHGTYRLVQLDPLTLRVQGPRSLALARFTNAWAESPDGSRLVFVQYPGTLRFVDPSSLRALGTLRLPLFVDPSLIWVTPRLLFVYDTLQTAAVDPITRRVLWRERVPHRFNPFYRQGAASTPAGVLILLSPANGSVGATTALSVDLTGHMRWVVLTRIKSGQPQSYSAAAVAKSWVPGVAVDPAGERAYVVGGDGTVADIDLSTLTVGYHRETRTLAVAQKSQSGQTREVAWLGAGLLAVTGENDEPGAERPAGLAIVDTRTWTTRLVDPGVRRATFANGTLLAPGDGLTAYTRAGGRVFHLLGRTPVAEVAAAGGLGYAWSLAGNEGGHPTTTVFDVRTGKVLRTLRTRLPAEPLIAFS